MRKTKKYHPEIVRAAQFSELVDEISGEAVEADNNHILTGSEKWYTVKHDDDIMLVVIFKESVVISFRGTKTGREWLNNCDGFLDSEGFHDGWNDVFHKYKDDIDNIVKENTGKKFFLYGHSRGGVIVIRVAYYIADTYSITINCITFGAPLLMDATRRDRFRELPINSTRCEIWRDPVSNIPPKAIGYKCESFIYALNNKPWYFLPIPFIGIKCHLDYYSNVRKWS